MLIVLMIGCFLLGMATRSEAENAVKEGEKVAAEDTVADTVSQTTIQNKDENAYRVEVIEEQLRGGENKEEIRFVSPEGNVVKSIPYGTGQQKLNFRVSPASNFVVNTRVEDLNEAEAKEIRGQMKLGSGKVDKLNIVYIDNTGKEEWVKAFIVESVGSETFPSYGIEFSKDGSRIVFYKNHKLGYSSYRCDITILDTLGREIFSHSVNNMIEGGLQIAPDGKIVGAPIYKDSGKHLIFIDVETGETKIVKAEGEGWEAWFSLLSQFPTNEGYRNLRSKHIDLWWEKEGVEGNNVLPFDEIPSDISTLFGDWK
jgi:hypothetical protein